MNLVYAHLISYEILFMFMSFFRIIIIMEDYYRHRIVDIAIISLKDYVVEVITERDEQ